MHGADLIKDDIIGLVNKIGVKCRGRIEIGSDDDVTVIEFEGKEGGGFDTTTAQVPVSLGQLSLTVEVSVIYDIR